MSCLNKIFTSPKAMFTLVIISLNDEIFVGIFLLLPFLAKGYVVVTEVYWCHDNSTRSNIMLFFMCLIFRDSLILLVR